MDLPPGPSNEPGDLNSDDDNDMGGTGHAANVVNKI